MSEKIKAISLFSSAGIGELRIHKDKVSVIAANELVKQRAKCYSFFYPETQMICDDITNDDTKKKMIKIANDSKAELLIATPPCQGLNTLGKNKGQHQYEKDRRNFLILEVLDVIDACDFNYILIENVPKFIEMLFPYNDNYYTLEQILKSKYRDRYIIKIKVLNAKDYGIVQSRPRAIIKMWKNGLHWAWPQSEKEITLKEAIGHLPSLEQVKIQELNGTLQSSKMKEQY
ncbi:MAG: DNA cytosine methyltransferase [Ruminococcus sp.]|nr:DNA cytosine methyltransferase [Ruminococcus sp.]